MSFSLTSQSCSFLRKLKSSSIAALPPIKSFENDQAAGSATLTYSPHPENPDDDDTVSRGALPDANEWPCAQSYEDMVYPEGSSNHITVDPICDSRPAYSSSIAHLASQQRVDLRWPIICAESSRSHDCEYIARKWPLLFTIHNIHDSTANPCLPFLMESAGSHIWHTLATVVGKSIQLKHGLLQVFHQSTAHALHV